MSPWHGGVAHDGQWSLAERKQDCDVSFPTHPASPPPAVVTYLMFLQVPAYPEVFRDGLHTFKLNEQDTDVRAALPAPYGHGARVVLCALAFPRGLFLHPPLSPGGVLHLTQALSSGPQTQHPTCSLLLPLLFADFTPPPLPPWLCGSIPSCGLFHISGICLGQRLRLCLTVNQSVPSVPSLW